MSDEATPDEPVEPDWRDDPRWQLVFYDPKYFTASMEIPMRPTAAAELAQPDEWASLYAGRTLVATWSRGLPS